MALATVAVKGEAHGAAEPAEVRSFVDDMADAFALASAFTPEEQAFIDSDAPADIDRIQFTWRYECYWVLLWALGLVETLGRPSSMCDPAIAMRILRDLARRFQSSKVTRRRPLFALYRPGHRRPERPRRRLIDEVSLLAASWPSRPARAFGRALPWRVASARRGPSLQIVPSGSAQQALDGLTWHRVLA